ARFENRSGNVVLLARQRMRRTVNRLDERVAQRQTKVIAEHGRRSDREDRPAALHELLQLRHRLRDRYAAEPCAELRRNRVSCRLAAESGALRRRRRITRRNGAIDEHQHVELRAQIPRVERLRVDDFERELVLLEQPARPSRRHRTAVLIPQAYAYRLDGERRMLAGWYAL